MNSKIMSILLAVVAVIFAMFLLFFQKGLYAGKAETHYTETTSKIYKNTSGVINTINGTVDTYNSMWSMACDELTSAKNAKDVASIESKYFPNIKGVNRIGDKLRRFEATMSFYIVTYFGKVEEDKKTKTKSLVDITKIDVSALMGTPGEEAVEEEGAEDGEEAVEEAPAPKKPAKAAKGKKGKKGKRR